MQQHVTVTLTGVTKCYGQRRLFENVNVSVEPGQCLAVLGPNGAGKSTFLKIVAGLVRPSRGIVRLLTACDQEIGFDERVGHVGLVSPELAFYPALSGYENIDFLTRAAGSAVSSEGILACFQIVGLAGRESDRLATYSTGMRQRLKFALLLAVRPSVWLLDEPFANLDAPGKALIDGLIRKAIADRVTVLIAANEREETGYAGKKIDLV
jgi:heme exporter protein A